MPRQFRRGDASAHAIVADPADPGRGDTEVAKSDGDVHGWVDFERTRHYRVQEDHRFSQGDHRG